jgi:hypothetical protein
MHLMGWILGILAGKISLPPGLENRIMCGPEVQVGDSGPNENRSSRQTTIKGDLF